MGASRPALPGSRVLTSGVPPARFGRYPPAAPWYLRRSAPAVPRGDPPWSRRRALSMEAAASVSIQLYTWTHIPQRGRIPSTLAQTPRRALLRRTTSHYRAYSPPLHPGPGRPGDSSHRALSVGSLCPSAETNDTARAHLCTSPLGTSTARAEHSVRTDEHAREKRRKKATAVFYPPEKRPPHLRSSARRADGGARRAARALSPPPSPRPSALRDTMKSNSVAPTTSSITQPKTYRKSYSSI